MPGSKQIQRKNRGEVTAIEISEFYKYSDIELIEQLKSANSSVRTCSAIILGERKSEKAIIALCEALKTEKSLYSKIAISCALGKIGLKALPILIKLLGKIGNNQYKDLPEKPFEKWNYPLPRDIAARTITKIGESALELLNESLPILERISLSEAIDAIGFISFYSKNQLAFKTIKNLVNQYKNDDLITWKLIRSLQAFPNQESIKLLDYYRLNHPQQIICLEAEHNLEQIQKKIGKQSAN